MTSESSTGEFRRVCVRVQAQVHTCVCVHMCVRTCACICLCMSTP